MEKIYDQAKDKNVSAIVIYGKGSDGKAYHDAAGTKQYETRELQDAFIKRAVIKIGNDYFIPISFTVATNVGTVLYAKAGTTDGSAATAKLMSVASDQSLPD